MNDGQGQAPAAVSRRVQMGVGAGIALISLGIIIRTLVSLLPDAPAGGNAAGDSTAYRGPVQYTVADTIGPGGSLRRGLLRIGITEPEVLRLAAAFGEIFNPARAASGHRYTVTVDSSSGLVKAFTYIAGLNEQWEGIRNGDGFSFSRKEVPADHAVSGLTGTVTSSLWQGMRDAGAGKELIYAFAEIFECDIDFLTECRRGDRFRLVFEEVRRQGDLAGYGRILAAEYTGHGGSRTAFLLGAGTDDERYYDPDGTTVRKHFLRSPLGFRDVTSLVALRRFQPILARTLPGSGVRYAAPLGTPVRSVADGAVAAAVRTSEDLGTYVAVRHADGYTSVYGHLQKFAEGIGAGVRVRQGQVLGYVGTTGRSSGPQLDFRMTRHGTYTDPLQREPEPAGSVSAQGLAGFRTYRNRLLGVLGMVPFNDPAAGRHRD